MLIKSCSRCLSKTGAKIENKVTVVKTENRNLERYEIRKMKNE